MTKASVSLLLAILLFATNVIGAGETDVEPQKKARALVQALGAETYSVRSRAREELMKLGRSALDALQDGIQAEDSEIRLRCIEMVLELRGRGFMGVGLLDETVGMGVVGAGGAAAGDDGEDSLPPVVAQNVISHKDPNYGRKTPFPAEAAGVEAGDRFVTINRRPILRLNDLFYEVILSGPARTIIVEVLRGEQRVRMPMVLIRNQGDSDVPIDLEKELPETPAASETAAPAEKPKKDNNTKE